MQNGKYQITAGTVDALIESLADQTQPDSLYIDVFLQTYRNFLTPALLLKKLKARFVLKSLKVVKEEEITHLTKEQLSQERKPESIELDAETLQLVKLRCASFLLLLFIRVPFRSDLSHHLLGLALLSKSGSSVTGTTLRSRRCLTVWLILSPS